MPNFPLRALIATPAAAAGAAFRTRRRVNVMII